MSVITTDQLEKGKTIILEAAELRGGLITIPPYLINRLRNQGLPSEPSDIELYLRCLITAQQLTIRLTNTHLQAFDFSLVSTGYNNPIW